MVRDTPFRLQKILDYRKQLEDQAQIALAEAQRVLDVQARAVEDLRQRQRRNEEEFAALKTITPDEVWLYREYKERLLQELAVANETLTRLSGQVEQRRTELVERSRDRKLLEKLKENQALAQAQEENRKEQKTFDETATLRHQDRDA